MKHLLSAFWISFIAATGFAATYPEFINVDANHIEGSLPHFREGLKVLEAGNDTVIRVLHIGDSHIQAEFVTNALRKKLQERYGNAGRGLLSPLRLAGTNQTYEYTLKQLTSNPLLQTRLLKFPWPVRPGVTGVAVESNSPSTIAAITPGDPFTQYKIFTSNGVTTNKLSHGTDSITLTINGGEAFYGVYVENGKSGIIYSAIGNNGACFTDYSLINNFPQSTAEFNADLIILSMGTNEGFSSMTDDEIERSVRNLIITLKAFNPKAELLVLLPMECQKNRNHGQTPLSPYYDVNKRVAEASQIIYRTARQLNTPVWDFYSIAGGEGASSKWLDAGLMNKDRIHLLKGGYELQADLMYDALTEAR